MMMKMKKVSPRQVLIALAIATVIYLMFANNKKSMYSVEETYVRPIRVRSPMSGHPNQEQRVK